MLYHLPNLTIHLIPTFSPADIIQCWPVLLVVNQQSKVEMTVMLKEKGSDGVNNARQECGSNAISNSGQKIYKQYH